MVRPKTLLAAAATGLLLALVGCGGDDEENSGAGGTTAETTQTTATATPETGTAETGTTETDGGATASEGREVFASTCGSCHTLSAAGTNGSVGPNLDELKPDKDRVVNAIETGPGAMPPGLLQGDDAETVAEFVAQNAGQ